MPMPSVIAIDGPVASGKTAVGREIARRLGYRFIDTGLMYRAVAYIALRGSIALDDEAALARQAAAMRMTLESDATGDRLVVDGEALTHELRSDAVEAAVSTVAAVRDVRLAMVAQQRLMAEEGSVVMVGRDIGTKVLPEAAKVYLDASPEERVRRRLADTTGRMGRLTEAAVRANVELRDKMDSERTEGPLRVAGGALHMQTDGLDIGAVAGRVIRHLEGG
jgi:cytidylate kinase